MFAAKSRNLALALAAIGVIALLAAATGHSSGRRATGGPPMTALGSVSSLSAYGRQNRSLCPGIVCYTPAQLQQAYDWPSGHRAPDGTGQTIMVVVAYGNLGLEADVQQFDSLFNIPSLQISYCGAANGAVNTGDPDAPGWGPETDADVEWAHAMAPGARIVLAVAPTDNLSDLAATEVQCVPQYPGAVVSQSWGEPESDAMTDSTVQAAIGTLHGLYLTATKTLGDTFVAGAGDDGAANADYTGVDAPSANYPASDPLVTAVGGTEGLPYPGGLLRGNFGFFGNNGGGYGGEQVWNEPGVGATGGAPSAIFPRPNYQSGFTHYPTRAVSDVAWDGAGDGGEVIVFQGGVYDYGGTSLGPPPWAALFALVDEERSQNHQDSIAQANPELYAIAGNGREYRQDFHDITVGNNGFDADTSFQAGPGYDLPTGLGTPDASNLINDLVGGSSNHYGDGNSGPSWPSSGGHGNGRGGQHHAFAGS
jgi:subtilase family serine protease